jgi:gamma-glutamylcysteine synthetase
VIAADMLELDKEELKNISDKVMPLALGRMTKQSNYTKLPGALTDLIKLGDRKPELFMQVIEAMVKTSAKDLKSKAGSEQAIPIVLAALQLDLPVLKKYDVVSAHFSQPLTSEHLTQILKNNNFVSLRTHCFALTRNKLF